MNPTTQREEAIVGFEAVPFIARRYQVIERLRRPRPGVVVRHQTDTEELIKDLEDTMIQLYCMILEYQLHLLRQFSHVWAVRYGRAVMKIDGWKSMSSQMETLDSKCTVLANELGQEELETGIAENNVKIDMLQNSWDLGLQSLHQQAEGVHKAVEIQSTDERHWRARKNLESSCKHFPLIIHIAIK